jgi:glycosyltransferase involved in cell wall biosynthesis
MSPRLSVAITTFNQAPYIGDAIRSVLQQSYTDLEIVVVDDGSVDETPDVVAQFGHDVRYIRQSNRGVAGARNRAVEASRGELVAFLDGDDLWEPDKLARQVELYDRYPGVGLLAGDVLMFDATHTLWERSLRWTIFVSDDVPYVVGEFYTAFLERNLISTMSQVMVPAAVLRTIGPSREALRVASDYELYLRIARRYPIAFINEVLTRWRYLATSVSGPADIRELRWNDDLLEALTFHAREAPASVKPLIHRRIAALESEVGWGAYQLGCRGERRLARRFLRHLVRHGCMRPVAYYVAVSLPDRVRLAGQHAMERCRSVIAATWPRSLWSARFRPRG